MAALLGSTGTNATEPERELCWEDTAFYPSPDA